MKKDSELANVVERVIGFSPSMGGVFSTADLAGVIARGSDLYKHRMINRLVRAGILSRVLRGLYITKTCDLWILSSRIDETSYVSMDSALASHGLIGSIPERSLSVVCTGKKRTIKTGSGAINFYSISPEFFFGSSRLPSGVAIADPEKAFIDLLYFYVKGARFLIDPLNDVNVEGLDKKKILKYLQKYKNPKFVKFVKGNL